jgi:hypothetical protein
MADDHGRGEPQRLDRVGGVPRVRLERDIVRIALAGAVPASVESHHARALHQPLRSVFPLSRMTREAVQEQHGFAVAAEVDAAQLG